jgi:hypothetical protein
MYSYFSNISKQRFYMQPRTLAKYSYMVIAYSQWQHHINSVHDNSQFKAAVGKTILTETTIEVTSICKNMP